MKLFLKILLLVFIMLVTTVGDVKSFMSICIHRDHPGSITAITNADGTKIAEYSFDPWGRQRDPVNLQALLYLLFILKQPLNLT
jgi:hypothetical protein